MEALTRSLAVLCWVACLALGVVAQTEVETEEDLAFLEELRLDFMRGGSHSASVELDEYLVDFPRSVTARRLAAEAALSRGRLSEAEEHLAAAGDPDAGLVAAILLRAGRYEQALELAAEGNLSALASARLRVAALDGTGQRQQALALAHEVCRGVDDRLLDGRGLLDLGWLLAFQRRYEVAAQALVHADKELNGLRGPSYRLTAPEVLVLLGGIYQSARQSGQGGADRTLTTLNEVLELDAGNADALVVKARAYQYGMQGSKAREALDKALSRDASHPEALVLRGHMRLLARRVEPALQAADSVLATNERHRGALALRAAALAVTRHTEEAAAARERFESAHPESNELDVLLGRVLQSHYRFAESIAPLERALITEPEDEEPLAIMAQSLAHVGREIEARGALEEHLRRSPYPYPWRQNMIEVLSRLADTYELEQDGFRLRLPPGEQDVLGVLLPERLAQARADMQARWEVDPEQDVLVEVFDKHADFSVRTVGFEGFMALGACFGRVMTLISPLSEMRGSFQWEQTAVHEYAHVVTLTLSRQRMPRWLSEGVSVVEEAKWNPRWTRPLERTVLDARKNDLVLPVERLDEAFQDGSTIMLGYYLGSLVCEVVERDFGFEGLRGLVAAYADGRTTTEAVRDALGIEPAELDARVLAYIDTEIAARAVVRPHFTERGKDAARDRVMAGDETALVDLAYAYHDLGRRVDRDAALERALTAVGETPALLRLLAERDLEAGRRSSARERLERWAATDAVDADGLALLARLAFEDGDREAGIALLQRARRLAPRDILPLLVAELDRDADPAGWREAMQEFCLFDETSLRPRLQLARDAATEGRHDEARLYFTEAVGIEPYDPELRLELAETLVALGDLEAAAAQWRLVLGMRPQHMPPKRGAASLIGGLTDGDEVLAEHQAEARRRLEETAEGSG